MQDVNRARIENHYLQVWDDWEIVKVWQPTIAERNELWQMYSHEVRAVPDNSWCGPCVMEWLKELINLYKNEKNSQISMGA
jgi:hypothetical protein